MSPEDRIRRLTEDIIACRDEAQAVILTRNLGIALHEHIERPNDVNPALLACGAAPVRAVDVLDSVSR